VRGLIARAPKTATRMSGSTEEQVALDALRGATIVKDYADQAGINSNNAGVRVFRARDALRKQVQRSCGTCATHGCVDCTCGDP
jgi:hypothetical protein